MDMNGNRTIMIVVGVVILLLLAFLVFGNRDTAEQAANTTQQVATSTARSADIAAARTEAAADLAALRTRQEAGETYASLQGEYAEVRSNLSAAYANAEGATKEEWNELEAEFDAFEASARANTGGFLQGLASLISRLGADVSVESSGE